MLPVLCYSDTLIIIAEHHSLKLKKNTDFIGAGEMAQLHKAASLTLVPRIHMKVERENGT